MGALSGLAIYLLGTPRVEREQEAVPGPRGHKAWGLLAYLLRTERAPSRDQLVSLLFSEAADPFGALRWNLSALRRILGAGTVEGDPLRLALPPGAVVDIETLVAGSWIDALRLPGIESELLEGMRFSSSPAFEIWLVTERRHLRATAEAVLREAALARLGAGDTRAAADLAGRLVRMNPLDENFQTLFVRSLAASGDALAAGRQVAHCRELFRRELGVEPSVALTAAARTITVPPPRRSLGAGAAARAELEAGEAAISAGALDAGLHCLRQAVANARAAADLPLQGRALVALGSALVHAARGGDEEAAAALHEALVVAGQAELASPAAAASRELGYVEFLRARYDRATGWLVRAAELAADDHAERGRISGVLGSILTDTAHYKRAFEELDSAVRLSSDAADAKQLAWNLSMLGRACLIHGELEQAQETLDQSLALARKENWTAFTPWPESLRGDVALAAGASTAAHERYEHAFALGCQLGDPCWEGIAARGLALVAAARGHPEEALTWLSEARSRCLRLPDAYLWVEAYILDALCSLAVEHRLPACPEWIEKLAALSARAGMREFVARANIYRGRLGDSAALTAARILAAEIDNPALSALINGRSSLRATTH